MENEIIEVTGQDGTVKKAEILLHFSFDDLKKDYVLYTFNEVDDKNLATVYASEVIKNEDGSYDFMDVSTDEEWKRIKEVMKKVIIEMKEA